MRSPGGKSPYLALALYGAAGFQLAASVVAGLVVGDYIDDRAGTRPWLMAAGVAAGFAGGLVNLARIVKSAEGEDRKGENDDKE